VLSGFVLARSSAGVTDGTIRGEVGRLERVREWFERALWEMEPADADAYFGRAMHGVPSGTRLAHSQALRIYFEFLELRHKVEIHAMTGRVVECPIDDMNRPRGSKDAKLRIPPRADEMAELFSGWARELASCRKFAPSARNYTAAKLMAGLGLRVNEVRCLDLDDIKWELGRFGKLHVRHGKGARASGPRERMVPLINDAGLTLRWFIEDVWGYDSLRSGVSRAGAEHLPTWTGGMTPHVLRHYCASELYLDGVDLISIQEMLGHAWVATTMRYIHVHRTRIEDAWVAGQERAATRLEGLV
jgi:integrase